MEIVWSSKDIDWIKQTLAAMCRNRSATNQPADGRIFQAQANRARADSLDVNQLSRDGCGACGWGIKR